jgi:hypothetical protein
MYSQKAFNCTIGTAQPLTNKLSIGYIYILGTILL